MSEDIKRIIEDYLKMVKKHLPNSNADDIIEELRSHILDAAQENVTGEVSVDAVWKIIGSFGAPSEVAQQYLKNETFVPQRASSHSDSTLYIPEIHWIDVFIMMIITFIVPFQIMYWGYGEGVPYTSLNAILWGVPLTVPTGGNWYIPPPLYIGVSLGFFHIIFFIQFLRYFTGKTTIKRLLLFGVFTMIIPMISLLISLFTYSSFDIVVYTGPIPVQLVAVFLILYYRGRIVFGNSSQEEIPDL